MGVYKLVYKVGYLWIAFDSMMVICYFGYKPVARRGNMKFSGLLTSQVIDVKSKNEEFTWLENSVVLWYGTMVICIIYSPLPGGR